ncbi:MAG: abortive phage resistance protein, partial [Ignavibacteriales bacterium]|nr:abortive phage resistance protein [Ignavibacteriales bacterium]
MAKNDTIILDGILDDRVTQRLPSTKRDEVFEYFAIEQILKDFQLSKEEISIGQIDGRNDGGIDGIYIFVNGHLLSDYSESFFWPRTNAELELYIITCKHHETFKQATFDNLVATLTEILDFGINKEDLKGSYNTQLLLFREVLKKAYRKLATRLVTFTINVSYASRGDSGIIGESIVARGNQILDIAHELFTECTPKVSYFGSSQLVELSRRIPSFSLELPFLSSMGRGERYILLSKLSDFNTFICDNENKLRRYLFDSNVRAYM